MKKEFEEFKDLTIPMGLYKIGHGIGQGLGWFGFWIMWGLIAIGSGLAEMK